MDSTAHGSQAFLVYYIFYYLIWNTFAPPLYGLLVIIFGVLPDLDALYFALKGEDPKENTFQHHLHFGSHWPITYIPLIILFIISLLFDYYPEIFMIPMVGVYTHLICDSACCGDGMMWMKTYKKDEFAPFINLFSEKTDGYHGNYWAVRWRRTLMFKIANVEAIIIIIMMIIYMVKVSISTSAILIVLFFIISVGIGLRKVPDKYQEEPPKGRYDDYRKNKAYLRWMEENGYEFDKNMHVKKRKGK